MFVGVLRFSISIPGARSLKDKRSVVRSLKERAQARLKIAIAEVGSHDNHRHATFGVACVSGSAAICDKMLASVASMAGTLKDAILEDRASEIISFGEAGRGVRGGIEQTLVESMNEDTSIDDEDDET